MTNDSAHSRNQGESFPGVLSVCGISHRSAALSEREPFQIGRGDLVPAVKLFKTIPGVREIVVLSTCNRLEFYMLLEKDSGAGGHADPFGAVCEFFRRHKGVETAGLAAETAGLAAEIAGREAEIAGARKLFYVRHGSTVARHLFRVISGLDSVVLGEHQVRGQVKEAYSAACSARGAGKVLHKLFHMAFRAGKAVRSRTGLGKGRYSVAGAAVHLVKERLDKTDRVLIIGVNESARIVAEGLASAGWKNLLFANRTPAKAAKMADLFGGEGFGLDDVPGLLARCRGLVTCTGAPGFVIKAGALETSLKVNERCPNLVVDMAMPRDVEVTGGLPESIKIADLEDLKAFIGRQEKGREANLPAAENLVEDKVASFRIWIDSAFDPGVANLAKEYDRIRRKCLEEAADRTNGADREEIENFSRVLVERLLKVPVRSFLDNRNPADIQNPADNRCPPEEDVPGHTKRCNKKGIRTEHSISCSRANAEPGE